jgi:hypothetical protein
MGNQRLAKLHRSQRPTPPDQLVSLQPKPSGTIHQQKERLMPGHIKTTPNMSSSCRNHMFSDFETTNQIQPVV